MHELRLWNYTLSQRIFPQNLIYLSCRLSSQACADMQTEILALYAQPYLTPSRFTEINWPERFFHYITWRAAQKERDE